MAQQTQMMLSLVLYALSTSSLVLLCACSYVVWCYVAAAGVPNLRRHNEQHTFAFAQVLQVLRTEIVSCAHPIHVEAPLSVLFRQIPANCCVM